MKLNPTDIARLKPQPKPFKISDGGGLYLYVAPSGGKLWRYDYNFNGKRKTLSLGAFPAVSLDDARTAWRLAKDQVELGKDPAAEKQVAKRTAKFRARTTFAHVAAEVIVRLRQEGKARTTIRKRLWLLRTLAKDLRPRPIADITAPEILAVLQQATKRGRLESARRLRAAIGQVFRLAVATNRATLDPTPSLRGLIPAPKVKHRAAVTTPVEAGKLMTAISGYDQKVIRCALLLSAYTFVRPGELRLAVWSELDLRNRVWAIPAERTKMRREHRVPLSEQALKQFQTLRRITGRNDDGLCFPGLRAGRPISENTLNAALRTLGFDGDTHVAHGFRAMASTILNEHSDFSPDAIEKALGHMEGNGVRRAYHRAEYWAERVQLMNWYADFLDRQGFKVWKERVLA